MEYKYILKQQLPRHVNEGWEHVRDIEQFVIGRVMKECLGFKECLIKREGDNLTEGY